MISSPYGLLEFLWYPLPNVPMVSLCHPLPVLSLSLSYPCGILSRYCPSPVVSLFVLSLLSSFGHLKTCLGYSATSADFTHRRISRIEEIHASANFTHRSHRRISRIAEVVARQISRIVEFHASVNFTHRQVSRIGEFHTSANFTHGRISRIKKVISRSVGV